MCGEYGTNTRTNSTLIVVMANLYIIGTPPLSVQQTRIGARLEEFDDGVNQFRSPLRASIANIVTKHLCSQVERSATIFHGGIHVGSCSSHCRHGICSTTSRRSVDRRCPMFAAAINISTSCNQYSDCDVVVGGLMQWRETETIDGIHVGAGLDQ